MTVRNSNKAGTPQSEADQARLFENLKKTIEKLKTFDEIGKTLTSTLDLKEILNLLLQKISVLLKPSHWGFFLLDQETLMIHPELAVVNGERINCEGVNFDATTGITGWALKNRQGLFVQHPKEDPRYDKNLDSFLTPQTYSLMIVPLKFRQSTLGVLQYASSDPNVGYNEEDYTTLLAFADYLAIAIQNARNFAKVEELTITDDLTKLFNSRYLRLILEREFKRFERYQEPFSLLFLDLDNFKKVNDTYGHLAGSQILIEIGDTLLEACRNSDVPIRYGGDEFIVILPKTDTKQAMVFARRIHDLIRSTVYLKGMNLNLNVTASFGIATVPDNAQTLDDLIKAADNAMYSVKKTTKDAIGEPNRSAK